MWAFPSRLVVRVLAVLLAASTSLIAQSYHAGVRGAVRDATGVMVSVNVVLVNEETTVERATITNASGEYTFSAVAPGLYTVRAVADGFRTFESRGIRIGTQDYLTLDIVLELGEVREAVVVTGQTPVIEQANASIGATLDRATLESLPNAGRNPFVLATTAPTVLPTGSPQFVRIQDQNQASMLSVAGGPRRGNNYQLDGVPIGDLFNRAIFTPSIETVQEVKVQVSTYDAELGRTGGGVFNTTFKAGANTWRGSALYLNRPEWATGTQFFTRKAGTAKPDLAYHLWAGSLGGPVIKRRTFFWASTEGYDSLTTQNGTLALPTAIERRGDFSRSAATIYDPLTTRPDPSRPGQYIRDPFPGNVIPADRINPVARNLVNLLPLPDNGRALTRTASISDLTNQATAKLDHRLSDRHTLSGLFAWYHSNEPGNEFYGGVPGDPGAVTTPRTTKVLALNAVSTPSEWTTVAIRYGYTNFSDDSTWKPNDPSTLGFDPAFARELTGFPAVFAEGYGSELFNGGSTTESTHYSHSLSASWTRLVGRHALKAGGDYRRIGLRVAPDRRSGFNFTTGFTKGPDPNGAQNGDAMASFLLGIPASGGFSIPTPSKFFTNYAGTYVQDDFRLGSSLTVNLGLRIEFEQGLQEQDDAFTVGFDRDRAFPIQVPGLSLKGGLMYAGHDGYPTRQGKALNFNVGPRAGLAWSLGARTVVRGGYGLFWAPSQIPQTLSQGGLGTRGFTGATNYVASNDGGLTPCPGCSLTNPFPQGLEPPQGAAQGLLTGAGGSIDFIDESSGAARVHRYSLDVQRELPGRIALTMGYVGSRSEGLSLGGTVDSAININQLDPKYLTLGSALLDQVPNPFFGNSSFGALSTTTTLTRGQLLRPYPQFGHVLSHRVTASRSRYDALVVSGERRQQGGWGARVNYTYSVLKDNQSGEGNAFANNPVPLIDNYDLERQYGYSLRDTPHRLNISGTLELPFGTGRRWLSDGDVLSHVLGGWTLSGVGVYQSGFPFAIIQNPGTNPAGAFGFGQRPNVVPGVDPVLTDDPADSYDPGCSCIRWSNPAAWSLAPPWTLGNAPHADPNARTPLRTTWDAALSKTILIARARLTLRAEVFNVFDQPTFFSPLVAFGPQNFGQIGRDGGFPRTLQLMARMAW